MILSNKIRQMIESRFGPARYPSDMEALSADIAEKSGLRLSVNTLKRLFGFISPEVSPRSSTLDAIAMYLGHETWNRLQSAVSGEGNSIFENVPGAVETTTIEKGKKLKICYSPGREVVMECLGSGVFKVISSVGSKLRQGDFLSPGVLCPGYPMIADNVARGGTSLGRFIAGKEGGLTEITLLP